MKRLLLILSFLAAWPALASGYWLTAGSDSNGQPVPFSGTFRADLPLDEQRSLYLGVVPTELLAGSTVQVR